MNVKCLIIDDEPLAIKVIENHIGKIPWLEVVGKSTNPLEGINILKKENIDLLFLDIQMPELTGLEFISSLAKPPQVIFTTAFRQFAADAFDLDGLDYLLKPIAFPRFLRAVNKYIERFGTKNDIQLIGSNVAQEERSFFIKHKHEMIKIKVDDIQYIESLKDYVQIFLQEEKYIYKARISNLEEELAEDHFIRIHKSFLVPIDKITSVSPTSYQNK